MSALGCFGRFTLFSPRVSHSNTCRLLSFVCFVLLFGFVALVCFVSCFLLCWVFWFFGSLVPLPLLLHPIPCHHIPNRPLLSLTLQVSRSLLRILPPPPPPTLSPLRSPPSLILRYRYLTPLLVVAPPAGTQIPFSQNSYQAVIPLRSNDQGLPR